MEQKLQIFKDKAEGIVGDFPEIKQVYLIKSTVSEDWGLLNVEDTPSQEEMDFHCDQCTETMYPFRMGPYPGFPYYSLSASVSPKKMRLILDGKIKMPDSLKLSDLLVDK